MLNHTSGRALGYGQFGAGDGPIWIAYLRCQGDEESIFNCPMSFNEQRSTLSGMFIPRGGNRHMCFSHNSDAAVQCYDSGTCTSVSAKTYLHAVRCVNVMRRFIDFNVHVYSFFSSFQSDLWIQRTYFTVAWRCTSTRRLPACVTRASRTAPLKWPATSWDSLTARNSAAQPSVLIQPVKSPSLTCNVGVRREVWTSAHTRQRLKSHVEVENTCLCIVQRTRSFQKVACFDW